MTGKTTHAGHGSCHCTALRKASRRISQLYDAALAPSGLKATQRAILAQLERSAPATVGALAEALVMDPGGLAHTLKPLLRDGLVTTEVDPADRRHRLLELTPKGRARLARSDVLWQAAQRGFEAGFGGAEAETLHKLMRRLADDDFAAAFQGALPGRAAGAP